MMMTSRENIYKITDKIISFLGSESDVDYDASISGNDVGDRNIVIKLKADNKK
jgi:hypothetical protein